MGLSRYVFGGTVDNNVRSGEMFRFQFSSYPKVIRRTKEFFNLAKLEFLWVLIVHSSRRFWEIIRNAPILRRRICRWI